jgi:hypothetical protein
MKSLLTIFFSILFSIASGQSTENNNCDILVASLNSTATKKIFNFAKRKNASIVIIDTSNFFKGCLLPQIYERDLVISSDYSLLNPSQLKDTTPSYVFIYGLYKKQAKYRLNFFYKWTGALGFIELRKRGKKMIVSKTLITGYH